MTTLTLLVKPVPSTSLTMQKTINNPWQSSTTSSALIQTHPHSLIQQFSQNACTAMRQSYDCAYNCSWIQPGWGWLTPMSLLFLFLKGWRPRHHPYCFTIMGWLLPCIYQIRHSSSSKKHGSQQHLYNHTCYQCQWQWWSIPTATIPWWPITCHSLLHTSLLTWQIWMT